MPNVDPPKKKFNLFREPFLDDPGSQKPNQPFIMDMVTLEKLFFQNIPEEIGYEMEAGWQVVNCPGRNNPLYQYTGSEDTISMTLTWYADVESRSDVIRKCKWLETLSKNNGYDEKPHRVIFCFGDLFKSAFWIVYSAPYKLRMFDREFTMMPRFAETELTLKRITELNRSRNDILKIST